MVWLYKLKYRALIRNKLEDKLKLAIIYYSGERVPKNFEKGNEWLQSAINEVKRNNFLYHENGLLKGAYIVIGGFLIFLYWEEIKEFITKSRLSN